MYLKLIISATNLTNISVKYCKVTIQNSNSSLSCAKWKKNVDRRYTLLSDVTRHRKRFGFCCLLWKNTFVRHWQTCSGRSPPCSNTHTRKVFFGFSCCFSAGLYGRKDNKDLWWLTGTRKTKLLSGLYYTVVAVQIDYMSLLRKTDCIATGVSLRLLFLSIDFSFFNLMVEIWMKKDEVLLKIWITALWKRRRPSISHQKVLQ